MEGYAYSRTAASALREIGAAETIDEWCATHADAVSSQWVCEDKRWSELWPELIIWATSR